VQVHLPKVMQSPVCLFCMELDCNPTGCLSSFSGSHPQNWPKNDPKNRPKNRPVIFFLLISQIQAAKFSKYVHTPTIKGFVASLLGSPQGSRPKNCQKNNTKNQKSKNNQKSGNTFLSILFNF
jgi:hypothetical protein